MERIDLYQFHWPDETGTPVEDSWNEMVRLIENGKVRRKGLAKELLTESELASVCRRQGFEHVHEVESCVLEPGGTFFLRSKIPSLDESRHAQLLDRIEKLSKQVELLTSTQK